MTPDAGSAANGCTPNPEKPCRSPQTSLSDHRQVGPVTCDFLQAFRGAQVCLALVMVAVVIGLIMAPAAYHREAERSTRQLSIAFDYGSDAPAAPRHINRGSLRCLCNYFNSLAECALRLRAGPLFYKSLVCIPGPSSLGPSLNRRVKSDVGGDSTFAYLLTGNDCQLRNWIPLV